MPTALPLATAFTDAGTTEAQLKIALANLRAAFAEMGDPMGRPGAIQNLSLVFSVAANALTIAVKDRAAADPTATAPVSVAFRNVTAATGDFSVINVTAASSLVVSSGSTLGTSNTVPFRLWVVAFNDGSTWRIGVINCLSGTNIYPLSGWGIASSTAEGGAGAADSAQVFYTGAAVSAKGYVVLGYATWETGLATAGTWSAGPTRVQLFGNGVPLPGHVVQVQRTDTGALATGTTTIPSDDTIPQSTEGDQYMSQAITPSSAANVLRVEIQGQFSNSNLNGQSLAMFQDAVANALKAIIMHCVAGSSVWLSINHLMLAAITASTTFKARCGGGSAGTTTFNGQSGGRFFAGVMNGYIQVQEIQA